MTAHTLLSQFNIYNKNISIENNILTIKLKKCVHLKVNALSSRMMNFKVIFFNSRFSFFYIFILYWNIVNFHCCVSDVWQSDSVIHTHISILFQVLSSYRLLQNFESSSLCYTLGLCCLFYIQQSVYVNPKPLIYLKKFFFQVSQRLFSKNFKKIIVLKTLFWAKNNKLSTN